MRSCSEFGCTRSPRRTRRMVCRLNPVSLCKVLMDIFRKPFRKDAFAVPAFPPYRFKDGSNVLMSFACPPPRSVSFPIT
jgi:hypothetical protein